MADRCDSANTYVKSQWILYPLGAILTGAGVYLLLTDKKSVEGTAASEGGHVQLIPSAFPGRGGGGRLDLRVAF